MWPFHKQPLYAGAMPTMFNATVLNGMSLTGDIELTYMEPLSTYYYYNTMPCLCTSIWWVNQRPV